MELSIYFDLQARGQLHHGWDHFGVMSYFVNSLKLFVRFSFHPCHHLSSFRQPPPLSDDVIYEKPITNPFISDDGTPSWRTELLTPATVLLSQNLQGINPFWLER